LPEGGSRLPGEPRRRLRRADLPLVLAAVLLLAGALAAGLYLTNRRNSSDDTTASGPSAGASASTTTTAAVPVTSPPAALSLPNKALFTQNGVSVVDAGFTSYTDATTTGSARKVSWALVVRNTLPDKTIRSATVEFQLLDVAGEEVGKGTVEVIHLAPGATSAGVSDDTEVPRKPAKLKVLAVKNVEVATPTPPTGAAQSSGVTVTAETAPNTVSASGTLVSTFGVAVKNANVSVVVENAAGNIVCGGAVTVPTIPAGQSVPYDLTFGCPVAGPYVAVAFVDIPPEAASTSTAS
jgi:hypothetical protein